MIVAASRRDKMKENMLIDEATSSPALPEKTHVTSLEG
jgi:hypothetical protein